ncbi:ExbD/TolR family protein [Schleiferia thermophila]|uniref:Outer membrane transport energization protein ExbD n=1 Tax=Schleiferia thermophila TaxID=884107 RepID=A0A369A795_9FLAO|nr:biopolymer transporter ExbD [Schleiferia thermophila]RCX03957.1 outer membrane transport energization protein ExbD [Schleiferia thermophila]GCD80190.1 biopolymer transporter ExbD [Schleiferia thermophila]
MAIEKARPRIVKLDMNPMVDMAFLLVTFFMLSTSFRLEEPTEVVLPPATADVPMPETSVMTIYINRQGQIFFGIDGKFSKKALLNHIGQRYQLEFTSEQVENFALLSGFGVSVAELPKLLSDKERMRVYPMKGIPVDSLSNELSDWIVYSRVVNPAIRVAVKADKGTEYKYIRRVINTLLENKILRFNLLTEKLPSKNKQ